LQELGRLREAVDPLRRVVRLRPQEGAAVEQLASLCACLGEDQAAAYLYRRARALTKA
jgi:Flp pilus assembly protein TadD